MAVSMDALNVDDTRSTPPEDGLDMPRQNLTAHPGPKEISNPLLCHLARMLTFGGTLALSAYAGYQMYHIISIAEVTRLQWAFLVLFIVTFTWIALTACSAITGFLLPANRFKSKPTDPITSTTALVMPVYNEDPAATCAALFAMANSLSKINQSDNFEIFILSDTTDPDIWIRETAAVDILQKKLRHKMPVWYRRRYHNIDKKSGNITEFVERWGKRYDYMVVLDADSLIAAETLATLVREMQADPDCGLIQTLPVLYAGQSWFARMQQFAGMLYGPVIGNAVSAWQGNDGNYWGHNAIIRMSAFAASAGLPHLPGNRPFGGNIQSHDFVEAALMRRAGWNVRMLPGLPGSWEESPPTMLDAAVRDRRWAQGNIQHLAVMPTRGLRWPNRLHMLIGVMSYLASPIWLAMMIVGLIISSQIASQQFDYFSDGVQLFPNWPVFDSQRMIALFIITMGVLLLPKVIGLIRGMFVKSIRQAQNPLQLILSFLVELILSVLVAPIFMLLHCTHIWQIFRGKDSGWSTQQRDHQSTPWSILIRFHSLHTAFGALLFTVLYWQQSILLYWLMPVYLGLMISLPLSRFLSSTVASRFCCLLGLLRTREEACPIEEISIRNRTKQEIQLSIDSLTLHKLLAAPERLLAHQRKTVMKPLRRRGHPDMILAAATLKIDQANTLEEAYDWLNKMEFQAALSDSTLLSQLSNLYHSNKRRKSIVKPGTCELVD